MSTKDDLIGLVEQALDSVRAAGDAAENGGGCWEFEEGQLDAAESLLIGIESHLHTIVMVDDA